MWKWQLWKELCSRALAAWRKRCSTAGGCFTDEATVKIASALIPQQKKKKGLEDSRIHILVVYLFYVVYFMIIISSHKVPFISIRCTVMSIAFSGGAEDDAEYPLKSFCINECLWDVLWIKNAYVTKPNCCKRHKGIVLYEKQYKHLWNM